MTSVRKVVSAAPVALAVMIVAATVILGPATAIADPAGHQVTYTVTSPNNLTATVNYVSSDPPSQAAYNADSSNFSTSVQVPLSGGQPVVYTGTIAFPIQWTSFTASGMLPWPDWGNVPASFHCETAVDGQVVVKQD